MYLTFTNCGNNEEWSKYYDEIHTQTCKHNVVTYMPYCYMNKDTKLDKKGNSVDI